MSSLKTYQVIKPSREEQKEIVAVVSKCQKQIEAEEVKRRKLQSIKQGLMQDLLTGKVSVSGLLAESAAGIA